MARIELKYCTIRLKDGLTGTGAADNAANPAQGDTTLTIGTLAVNTLTPTKMPVGARFRIAGEKVPVDHVVTARTQDVSDPTKTTDITFAPALGEATSTYEKTAALTIKPQQLDIKIGDGNLTYTEHRDYTYLLDRGWLDTVREPKDVPMDVKLDAVYEHIVSATGEHVCPMEALKGTGAASEWVSSSPDQCEPYCIDVEVEYTPPCAPSQGETTLFPMFRAETREINYSAATIVWTGKCKAREPIVTRPS
ncbi:MAG: hypothetical protein WB763_15015 [Terriglobia bacterium]